MVTSDRVREDGSLTVRTEEDGDALLVRATGEVDVSTSGTLESELRRAIGCNCSIIFLDLSAVNFIDSAGFRAFFLAAKHSHLNGKPLRMTPVSAPVKRTIDRLDLWDSLPLD